jgi:WD40 repeat protein
LLALHAMSYSTEKTVTTEAEDALYRAAQALRGGFKLSGYTRGGDWGGIAFSPDGTRLATASADSTVQLYPLNIEALVALARTRVTRSLTPEECQKYLHVEKCPPTL